MTIEPMREAHVAQVAKMHAATLGGMLSQLGPVAIAAHYRGALRSAAAIGLVALDAGRVRGFVFGSPDPDRLRRDALLRNVVGAAGGLCVSALTRPRAMRALWASTREAPPDELDTTAPELTYLAVDPGARGSGTARQLVVEFTNAMGAAGITRFELSVEESNASAVAFYERIGFKQCGKYNQFGAHYRRYASADAVESAAGAEPGRVRATESLPSLLARFVRYGVAGIFATLVYFAAVLLLVEAIAMQPVTAAAFATVVVIFTSYLVNRAWVFDTNRSHLSAFTRFAFASLLSIAINTGTMYVAVRLLGWPYLAGALIATLLVPPLNFVVNYLWTFRQQDPTRP